MPLRRSDTAKRAELAAAKAHLERTKQLARVEAEGRRRGEVFARTPQGQARAAWHAGAKLFQMALPLTATRRTFSGLITGDKLGVRRRASDHSGILDAIEAEGWRLEHTGYVFEQTGSISRDKFMSSGQTASVTGEVIGVYIFRAIEKRDEELAAAAEEENTPE